MRFLVCGGRDYDDWAHICKVLDTIQRSWPISAMAHGNARGADKLSGAWAEHYGIPVIKFNANWAKYGNAAGPIRNAAMLEAFKPDRVLAFPGGVGTADMIKRSEEAGLEVWRVKV